ncbi:MAG TPA: LON peptidase substrate-binding domain-containing protein [Candidatus Polarisedimenticolia bacterium]|nr:LON peptidase substrate-binding domain-containing protein [Candidatus Polarisedimenticolia bacterium]
MPLLPLFPLEIVVFPSAPLPLHIFEPRYKEMIGECLAQDRPFGMVRAKENALSAIGCSARIVTVIRKYEDGRLDIAAEGAQRFEIIQVNQERSFLQAEVAFFEDETSTVSKNAADAVIQLHEQLFAVLGQTVEIERDADFLSFHLAQDLPVDLDFKQTLLEMKSEAERIETLTEYYRATIPKIETSLRVRQRASGNGHVH